MPSVGKGGTRLTKFTNQPFSLASIFINSQSVPNVWLQPIYFPAASLYFIMVGSCAQADAPPVVSAHAAMTQKEPQELTVPKTACN